jgi:hypothetical protein
MPCPSRFTPRKENRYSLYWRLGGCQGQSGQVQKILPPPGFDPQTFQPIASRYTNYTIPAPHYAKTLRKISVKYCVSTASLLTLYCNKWRDLHRKKLKNETNLKEKQCCQGLTLYSINGRMISVYWIGRKLWWPNLPVGSVENYEKCHWQQPVPLLTF